MSQVLVDTSVWVDHFKHGNDTLAALLSRDQVLSHPLILGEIACGTPPAREKTLADLSLLQSSQQASMAETVAFIEREQLYGLGCGVVDLLLLSSTLMTPGLRLWTLDKRLAALAERLGVMHQLTSH